MRQREEILWILAYAILLAIPELIMDLVATSRNFVNVVHGEATLLYHDLEGDASSDSDSDETVPSDIDSHDTADDAKED